mmetsp:Transcript_24393/g.34983  ORF Transcript_24393/g.34983 Transcript_24393/m.34983 type:complete len:464 (+) Transcript_24393:4031-5422(+)
MTASEFTRIEFPSRSLPEAAEDMWSDLPTYSHELLCRYSTGNGSLYHFDGSQWWHHASKRTSNLCNLISKCHLTSELLVGDPPESSIWVEIEFTKDALVILTESMRSTAAMRHLEENKSDTFLNDPVCIQNRIRALPTELRRIVGKVWFPHDNGQALINAIRSGARVYGVSDGSASRGSATHGWKLARGPADPLAIKGCGPVDGHLPSAFRAEMQGQLAVLIVSSLLVAARGIRKANIVSLCDNRATLRRMAEHSRNLRVRDHTESEVDLYLIYRDWIQKKHVQCESKWVKGHQDRHQLIQDIDDEGLLNMEVDRLATLAYTCPDVERTTIAGDVLQQEVYSIWINGTKITTKLKQQVINRCGEEPLRQYMLHKHRLSEGKMEGINWTALQRYLNSLSPPRRATQVKLQHNWIPTKGFLFLQRRESCNKCPLCKTSVETAQHVRKCRESKVYNYRQDRLRALS